jgi:hypothetical protein
MVRKSVYANRGATVPERLDPTAGKSSMRGASGKNLLPK